MSCDLLHYNCDVVSLSFYGVSRARYILTEPILQVEHVAVEFVVGTLPPIWPQSSN